MTSPAPIAPVLILKYHRENPKKCSVTAIEGRPGVEIRAVKPGHSGYGPIELEGGILLAVDSPPLTSADRGLLDGPDRRLVLIDANWIRVPALLDALRPRGPLVSRSLPAEVRTAYPRRSKIHEDPAEGLATIEALAAALALLGSFDRSILDGYHWAKEFLELNRWLFGNGDTAR
jgi:pre-rRNA-processing protein TSR3